MQTYEMVSAGCFVFASVLMNKCSLSKSYIMKYLLCIYIQCDIDVVLWLAGGQTYPQAGCRPRTLWEWVKGETGSGRLREHRWKSSEEWATGWKTSTSTSRTDLWKAFVMLSFQQRVSPGVSERNVAPGGEVEKVRMTIPPKRKRWKPGTFGLQSHNHPSHVLLVLICLCLLLSPDLSDALLPMQPSDVLDMPVDPNEPTYCLCHQVSYGEMIGCDNPDVRVQLFCFLHIVCIKLVFTHVLCLILQCPIEWFHFACVDLDTKPKGKWWELRVSYQIILVVAFMVFLPFVTSCSFACPKTQVLSTMYPRQEEEMRL